MEEHGHMHGMPMAPTEGTLPTQRQHHKHGMMMHMTFFWGENAEILFHGWPGEGHLGMYILAVLVVFSVAIIVEFLSHCNLIRLKETRGSSWSWLVEGLLRTVLYTVRAGLGYVVMLAVMSFNGGVFVATVAGHGVGFFFFGSRVMFNTRSTGDSGKNCDLPPMNCC